MMRTASGPAPKPEPGSGQETDPERHDPGGHAATVAEAAEDPADDETAYLMRSPANARRLLAAIRRLER